MSMGGCLLLLRFSMKRVSILDRDSFSPATYVSTPVVKLVVVGGERNPASLAPSFRVRGRELEGNPASLTRPSGCGVGSGKGRDEPKSRRLRDSG